MAGGFRLEPLGVEHTERDHAAFTSCAPRLREELGWGGWPPDGFTLEDNRADLAEHRAEHDRRDAFAYSVLDERGARCVGCIYLKPHPGGARLAYWVVDEHLDRERDLVEAVLTWIEREWPLDRVVLATRASNPRGAPLHAALGLTELGDAEVEDHHAFEWRRARS